VRHGGECASFSNINEYVPHICPSDHFYLHHPSEEGGSLG